MGSEMFMSFHPLYPLPISYLTEQVGVVVML
jgi:hypothetical protein